MGINIALVGNPNCGKTTVFNAVTGSNQFVGNWPGVTVEKKEGKIRWNTSVSIVDLPGIYSMSPYTPEEIVARSFLVNERPDVILNIVDGTNLERNLYLTTQVLELGLPVVIAINMMDVVRKNGDKINTAEISKRLGVPVVEISAMKSMGLRDMVDACISLYEKHEEIKPAHILSADVEHALAHIEEAVLHHLEYARQRWYAIKLFERDAGIREQLKLSEEQISHIEQDIVDVEKKLEDDSESLVANDRYVYVAEIIKGCYKKTSKGATLSDKIDRVVTNRILALPIFVAVMFVVYYIAVSSVGTLVTDWANDGVFGDGWHLFGIGSAEYTTALEQYEADTALKTSFETAAKAQGVSPQAAENLVVYTQLDGNTEKTEITHKKYLSMLNMVEPTPQSFGIWVPGVPGLVDSVLTMLNTSDLLKSLVLDGIVSGVGAVLGFVPQLLVLFLLLSILESCGYMARIAFIMDRVFRRFGLSGKSFIPMLIGTGCSVPGIMASRTIENERDRRITIITTSSMPCGAKLPVIALIAGALFGGSAVITASAYFLGIASIIISGVILKKTKSLAGEAAPFVMELPAYHMPQLKNVLRTTLERGWSFVKKAGTVILLSTIVLWFLQSFGVENGSFGMVENINSSVLAWLGSLVAWIFIPLGFGNWQSAVATITGLIAKENIVGTFGVVLGSATVSETGTEIWQQLAQLFTPVSGYAFLAFNLLCVPCFAAVGAIRREMNSAKWTLIAISYQLGFSYAVSLIIYQFGNLFTGSVDIIGLVFATLALLALIYLTLRKPCYSKLNLKTA